MAAALVAQRDAEQEATTATMSPYLNDDVCAEILLRLPPDAVLRSRAVCKAWRRISTDPGFVAAHAGRCPLELTVQRHGGNGALDTVPLLTLDETKRRCIDFEYPEYRGPPAPWRRDYHLIPASCDGLLMFQKGISSDHFVCNPETRQWLMLPRPPGGYMLLCGFYLHVPSGEHRILYHTNAEEGSHYVYSLEAAYTRSLGPAVPLVTRPTMRQPFPCLNYHGKLHWLWHPEVFFLGDAPDMGRTYDKIMAFDTVSETFRRMSRPPLRDHYEREIDLLETDGKLAMMDVCEGHIDVWVLDDYNDDRSWTRRFLLVDLPPALRRATLAMNTGAENPNVILLGNFWTTWAGLFDLKEKKLLKQFRFAAAGDTLRATRLNALVFRASLKRHAFFDVEEAQ